MRLLGITLPDEKRLEIALASLYGVGRKRAQSILDAAGVDRGKKAKDVTSEEENQIRKEIEKFTLEGDLKREISGNIKRLKDIGIISKEVCRKYGATGPVLRGSGVNYDVRRNEPYSIYPELDFDIPVYNECD